MSAYKSGWVNVPRFFQEVTGKGVRLFSYATVRMCLSDQRVQLHIRFSTFAFIVPFNSC